jgi:hypothetical protein
MGVNYLAHTLALLRQNLNVFSQSFYMFTIYKTVQNNVLLSVQRADNCSIQAQTDLEAYYPVLHSVSLVTIPTELLG